MSVSKQPSQSPELRVAPSRQFKPSAMSAVKIGLEAVELLRGPGDALNLMSGKKFRMIRDQLDAGTPYTGLHAPRGVKGYATDIPNPDSPDGRWDPYQYMPRFIFEKGEDALPVSPDFDGDTDMGNNAPGTPGGKGGTYKDGVIGGNQPLTGAFTVSKKGDYHILTYSFYYAHNKAGDYHQNDYSTTQIYLKPGPDGKLAPTHMMTSWHHGAVLTPWSDLGKDEQGRPMVRVQLGSHALQAFGRDDKAPTEGLQIQGDGQAVLNGKPVDQRLGFEVFQKNVDGARYLDPAQEEAAPRLEAMRWGEAAMNPFLPKLFEEAPAAWEQMAAAGGNAVKNGLDKAADAAESAWSKGLDKAKGAAESTWKKMKELF